MTLISRKKVISQASSGGNSADSARITVLENNEYKITYYEVVSGTSGSLTLPTGATINAGEFGLSGNAILSKIDGSNKPTFESPKTSGGTIVTASLNESTGDWVTSGTYTDSNVALIYSLKIKAIDYSNLTYSLIIEESEIGSAYIKNLTSDAQAQLDSKGNSIPIYSGKWRGIQYTTAPVNSTANHNTVWYVPYLVGNTHVVTEIGQEVTVATAASNIRLALYSDNNGVPGSLIEESGAISSATTGLKTYPFASPITLSASNQVYWMAVQASVTTIGLRVATNAVSSLYINGSGGVGAMYTQAQAFGAFPASATPVAFTGSSAQMICLKSQ